MAYSELIKNFAPIRDYIRRFYVYGFQSRREFDGKSGRSYDNARRRVESWLGDYVSSRQEADGKRVFLSVDSRQIPRNPLYQAFRAKSFTARDITLHFLLLDLLADSAARSCREIVEALDERYLSRVSAGFPLDESTVRKKLREYEGLGLLAGERAGQEKRYRRTDDGRLSLEGWAEALDFFAEADPLGVVGACLEDRLDRPADCFRFKHHYILHALDSDILAAALEAIDARRSLTLRLAGRDGGADGRAEICPLKIYRSTQTGRQYLLGAQRRTGRMIFFRTDLIRSAAPGGTVAEYDRLLAAWEDLDRHLWGVSLGGAEQGRLVHLELTVRCRPDEDFIPQRLERERRHGRVERLEDGLWRFTADVYDGLEMIPWLRTFIGRIVRLECSDPAVTERFYRDLREMERMYGDGHVVS